MGILHHLRRLVARLLSVPRPVEVPPPSPAPRSSNGHGPYREAGAGAAASAPMATLSPERVWTPPATTAPEAPARRRFRERWQPWTEQTSPENEADAYCGIFEEPQDHGNQLPMAEINVLGADFVDDGCPRCQHGQCPEREPRPEADWHKLGYAPFETKYGTYWYGYRTTDGCHACEPTIPHQTEEMEFLDDQGPCYAKSWLSPVIQSAIIAFGTRVDLDQMTFVAEKVNLMRIMRHEDAILYAKWLRMGGRL